MADIPATVPVVTPAVPAQTFPLWVVESLVFSGNGIEQPLTAEAWFRSARREPSSPSGWVLGDQRRMSGLVDTLTRLATAAGVL